MTADYMEALRAQLAALRRTDASNPQAVPSYLLLRSATPIFVAQWVARACMDSWPSLPHVSLSLDDMPVSCGFAYPERGAFAVSGDGALYRMALQSLTWGPAPGIPGAVLLAWGVEREDMPGIPLVASDYWTIGGDIEADIRQDDPVLREAIRGMRAMAYTLWAFMAQRRITTITNRGVDRALRKQSERQGWAHEPLIQVVELRASESRSHSYDGAAEPVDWSCRWAVRGHWHKYHYGDGTLRARFVAPYVKGPEGKPLRAATKLLAVVR